MPWKRPLTCYASNDMGGLEGNAGLEDLPLILFQTYVRRTPSFPMPVGVPSLSAIKASSSRLCPMTIVGWLQAKRVVYTSHVPQRTRVSWRLERR